MSFKAEQAKIQKKQGISHERAGAILAAGARKSSPAAIKANPALKHVHGAGSQYHKQHDSAPHKKNPGSRESGCCTSGPMCETPM